jgi:hypothetical protein
MPTRLWPSRANIAYGVRVFFLFLASFPLMAGIAWGSSSYEVPTDRRASEILPPNLVSGPHFRVRDRVAPDGYLYRFTVDSDYGSFPVAGEYGLRKLIKEIQAIAALKEVNKGQAVLAGARGQARETLKFGAELVADPVNTVASVPQGVAKLFSNIAAGLQNQHDPRRDTIAQKVLNVSDAKRKLAYDLGVDVYSSNRVLQNELDSVARAQALGALGVSAAIPYGGGAAVNLSRMSRTADEVNRLLRDEPPASLRTINQEKLQAMGVDPGLARRFLNHAAFSPRHDTIIVACLEKLSGAQGREAFIRFALSATDEETANFFQNLAEILRAYHQTVSPIREIVVPGILFARAANGAVLVPFPLDYAVWSLRAERVVKNSLASYQGSGRPQPKIELWVTGAMSPLAHQGLQAYGIHVVEHVDRRIGMMD